jgi:hypothetical protein
MRRKKAVDKGQRSQIWGGTLSRRPALRRPRWNLLTLQQAGLRAQCHLVFITFFLKRIDSRCPKRLEDKIFAWNGWGVCSRRRNR